MYEMQCDIELKLYRIHILHDQEVLKRKGWSNEKWQRSIWAENMGNWRKTELLQRTESEIGKEKTF